MHSRTGLDVLLREKLARLVGKRVSVLCNQASIASDLLHLLEHLMPFAVQGVFSLHAVFGPQHGLWGHTQDNMIEWEGAHDPRFRFPIYSLYGEHREPTDEMLGDTELVLIDLPDIGSRYYTFIWSTALTLKACEVRGTRVMVLDRPNPIGGTKVEGTVLDPEFASFVGLYPLPTRHGLTLGEIAGYLRSSFFPSVELEIVKVENWDREQYLDETGLPWAMPSPNMPTLETALMYPGACLLEGTALSEGRGTTRPFEIFGAPYIDGWDLCRRLNALQLPGVHFRPIQFEPTFQKHAGAICEGAFVHVTSRATFSPVLTYVAAIMEVVRLYPARFEWKAPPYEYEFTRLPFDILAGNSWLRAAIENLDSLSSIKDRFDAEIRSFEAARQNALLY